MRVVICVQHNMLMEPPNDGSAYVVCFKCKEMKGRGDPHWFPIELARRNHKDGAMKRTWVAKFIRWTKSGWQWERVTEDQWKQEQL